MSLSSPDRPRAVVGAATHPGAVRPVNQDTIGADGWLLPDTGAATLTIDLDVPRCLCVADGAGGHPAGDVASRLAAQSLMRAAAGVSSAEGLEQAVAEAHEALHARMGGDPPTAGMGTTIAAIVITTEAVLVGNVGDSRVYEILEPQVLQLSIDDNPALPPWAPAGAQTSVLTQMLGGADRHPPPAAHTEHCRFEDGLSFLLCSDGVTGCLDDATIHRLLSAQGSPCDGARALVDAALAAGAPDNASALVVEIEAAGGRA